VGSCCQRDYASFFGGRIARRSARGYRRHGVRGTAADLVELAGDVEGESILEVGGGIGAIELELLRHGGATATNVELSPEYEDAADELLGEYGLRERVTRRVGDFVVEHVEPHDVVVMHRVVCCYPDVDALVGTAAARTRRRMVLTYPQERPWTRAALGVVNLFLRLRGSEFRVFVHPFAAISAGAAREGLGLAKRRQKGVFWESAAFERLSDGPRGNLLGMEPRHQDFAAEEVSVDRENKGEEDDDRTGADTVDDSTPANDDTGYDAEIDDASQL
jgi:magnesium-protoporphyrin O-methyltransferase